VSAPTSPALLSVKDLAYAYNGVAAVRGVSLEVGAGEVVALLGANGAGKSTTVKVIAGALSPQAGSIVFDGAAIEGRPCHVVVRHGITLVPEGRLVFPQLSVLDNLNMGAHTRGPAETSRKLDYFFGIFPHLAERRNQYAGSMSGGEQQMIAIARGLMSSPRLMMLDEPSLGLMPKLVNELFRLIKRVATSGVSILLVEQNVHQLLQIAHRGHVMEKGDAVLSSIGQELGFWGREQSVRCSLDQPNLDPGWNCPAQPQARRGE
jgi:branched-chain amino acid transport system ATP-binding protein